MSKERKDNSFIKKPVYPGGTSAYRKFIKETMKYPQEAMDNKTEGVVYLKYSINHKGEVIDTKVLKGIGHGCDEEAKRILSLLKFDIPKGPRKLRVLFHQKTQITFRLPKQKAKPTPPKSASPKPTNTQSAPVVYTYKATAKKKPDTDKKAAKKSYTYTISGKINM